MKPDPVEKKWHCKHLKMQWMHASTLTKYSNRYEEGYDLQDDVLYNTWVKL